MGSSVPLGHATKGGNDLGVTVLLQDGAEQFVGESVRCFGVSGVANLLHPSCRIFWSDNRLQFNDFITHFPPSVVPPNNAFSTSIFWASVSVSRGFSSSLNRPSFLQSESSAACLL